MDLVYGLVGGLVVAWLGAKVIKKSWVLVLVAFLVPVVLVGWLVASGITLIGMIAALVGAIVGTKFLGSSVSVQSKPKAAEAKI